MGFSVAVEPITAGDDDINRALLDAELPALLPALAHATGDLSLLREDLRPDPLLVIEPQGGLTEEQHDAIRALPSARCRAAATPAAASRRRRPTTSCAGLMEFTVGGSEMDAYVPLLERGAGDRRRGPAGARLAQGRLAPDATFSVAIIGAGMSGLLAAHRLQQAGVPFVVLEKNDDVGGTWFENTYPGCRVDVPNHLYSYSFAQRDDWPQHFSTQAVLLDYFRDVRRRARPAPAHPLRAPRSSSARSTRTTRRWTLAASGRRRQRATIEADAVISAVGQLNRPQLPDIAGPRPLRRPVVPLGALGPRRRPARQARRGHRHRRQRGAVHPDVAEQAAHLPIFQRTPDWFVPDARLPRRRAATACGGCSRTCRLQRVVPVLDLLADGRGAAADGRGRPGVGADRTLSVSEVNEMVRQLLTAYLEAQFADRPELLAKVMPDYPPVAKRFLRDNGVWAAHAHARQRRRSSPSRSSEITADGRRRPPTASSTRSTSSSTAPGFQASKFLTPMQVIGRGGVDLHEHVGRRRPRLPRHHRARLPEPVPASTGRTPTSSINGSIIYFSECEVRYIAGLPPAAARRRPPRARLPPRRPRRATTSASTPRTAGWRGASRR